MLRMRGFTLAEVMLAVLILSLAVLGLLSVQAYAFRAQSKGTERNRASVIAASRMNALEAKLKDDFGASVTQARAYVPDEAGYEIAVAQAAVPPLDDLKELLVTVYWTDDQGPHEYDLRTRVLKP
jgi:prepilin-type N-terminal cleavage/methylation domain-containing protein